MRKHQSKKTSLRLKWIIFISLAIVLAIGVTMVFNHLTVKKILSDDNQLLVEENALNAANQVELGLSIYEKALDQLSNSVIPLIEQSGGLEGIDSIIETVQLSNEEYEAVYFMDFRDGLIHVTPPIDFDWDVRDSETFKTLTESPKMTWMDIYEDTITGKLMTSLIAPVMVNDQLIGAVGFDIEFSAIGKIREQIESNSNADIMIIDGQGLVVSAFLDGTSGMNVNPVKEDLLEGAENILANQDEFMEAFHWVPAVLETDRTTIERIEINGVSYAGYAVTVEKNNWKVVSLIDDAIFASKIYEVIKVSIFAVLFGLVVGIIMAIVLANTIIKIIRSFQSVFKKTASGDLVSQFEVRSNDEIGQLQASYNEMLDQIRELILDVNDKAAIIQNASDQLNTISENNNEVLVDISSSVDQIATNANEQSEQMQTAESSLKALNDEIDDVKLKSKTIEDEVHQALNQVETGFEKVDELQASYRNLEEAFTQVTTMTLQLDEKSKSISSVTDVISQITDQTNLLALNASIEAARAGVHGKGFAVVADEVRKLAEESKNATINIQMILTSVLKETEALVSVMNQTNQISAQQKNNVVTVNEAIKELSNSLNSMSSTMGETTESINRMDVQKQSVVSMIEQVSTITYAVTGSTQEMAGTIEEQTAATAEVAKHANHLSEQVIELNNSVNKFKL